jgi:hypothetical protein
MSGKVHQVVGFSSEHFFAPGKSHDKIYLGNVMSATIAPVPISAIWANFSATVLCPALSRVLPNVTMAAAATPGHGEGYGHKEDQLKRRPFFSAFAT